MNRVNIDAMSPTRKDLTEPSTDRWYSVAKTARLLGLSRSTVLARVATGELAADMIAERPAIRRESVEQYLATKNAA
jgi:excisionase family DNA binding protein